ncbi:MAG TPA: peptidoglycan recognition family protein [Pyrinomonadaceae bacterium]|nr:peptidoglycan recognition family protein [Pyrinomonadaceae bacterium]
MPRSHYGLVESYALLFKRADVRLRFLNSTLSLQSKCGERLGETLGKWESVRKSRLYARLLQLSLYGLIFREITRLLPHDSGGKRGLLGLNKQAPLSARVLFNCYKFRRPLYAVALVLLVGFTAFAYRGVMWSAGKVKSYLASRYERVEKVYVADQSARAKGLAERLPVYEPTKVWMVEQGGGFERYSNGARILNDFETENHARRFLTFKRGAADVSGEARSAPAGIVYHTSESDLLPFNEGNSDSIETRSKNLLAYVRDHKSYNYVIDRFGQIYRVVRDSDAAYHAGNSVWSDGDVTFTGLNESFLGVCFETKADTESGERLTEAQVLSGRLLTQVLRSRYQIKDSNCVTHGLVSVNPSNGRILFHHDWAQGFPFEAMGVSDKYAVPPASVAELGFGYDSDIVAQIGGRVWPGIEAAEEEFARRAAEEGSKPDALRGRMRSVYRERMDAQRAALRSQNVEPRSSEEAGPES